MFGHSIYTVQIAFQHNPPKDKEKIHNMEIRLLYYKH